MWISRFYLVALVAIFLHCSNAQDNTIGVFYGKYTDQGEEYKRIVDDAIDHVGGNLRVTHLVPEIVNTEKVFYDNINQALRVGICNRVENTNLKALIVPNDICVGCRNIGGIAGDAVNPVITTDLTYDSSAIKLYPSKDDLTDLFISLVNYTKWTDFIIIYDHTGADRIVESMMVQSQTFNWRITPYQVKNLMDLRDKLRNSRVKNILLFCEFEEIALSVVRMAIDEELMTDSYHWMLGNINLPLVYSDIDKIRLGRAYVTRLAMEFGSTPGRFTTQKAEPLDEWPYRLRLTYDAVLAIDEGLRLHRARLGNEPAHTSRCPNTDQSSIAAKSSLLDDMKRINLEGMSGPINFDQRGNRVNYTIDIYMGKGLTVFFHSDLRKSPIGTWTQDIRSWETLNGRRWPNGNKRLFMRAFRNADLDTIKISSLQEAPYLIDDSERGFYGYIPTILEKVKRVMEDELGLPFDYQLELVSDGDYGRYDSVENRWSGLMSKLTEGHSDIAAAPLAITSERDSAVDFTIPFLKAELGVLIMHPNWVREHVFAVMFPYSATVWVFFVLAVLFIGLFLWGISYLNPYEWRKLAERGQATEEQGNYLNFWNAPWFQTSTILFQGYDHSPRSWASRTISAFWFWFSLMMIFIYLLNLSPFLTASKNLARIKDIGQLMRQTTVDVGFVRDSSAYDFFRNNEVDQYRRMWEYIHSANSMYREDSTIVGKIEDGIHRVRHSNGQYALIHDRATLIAESRQRRCSMYITGGHFALVEYGFAVPSGSPLRDQLTYVFKVLHERNEFEGLLDNSTWFDPEKDGPCRTGDPKLWKDQTLFSITTGDLIGIYLLLAIGMAVSIGIFLVELVAYNLGVGNDLGGGGRGRPIRNQGQGQMRTEQYAPAAGGGGDGMDGKGWI